jgi:hypothetical protein
MSGIGRWRCGHVVNEDVDVQLNACLCGVTWLSAENDARLPVPATTLGYDVWYHCAADWILNE